MCVVQVAHSVCIPQQQQQQQQDNKNTLFTHTGLGISYIVNAPSLYSMAWNLLSPFLDSTTKTKIKFVTCDSATMHDPTKNQLLADIDAEVLLQKYGGTSPFEYSVDAYAHAVAPLEGEGEWAHPGLSGGAKGGAFAQGKGLERDSGDIAAVPAVTAQAMA